MKQDQQVFYTFLALIQLYFAPVPQHLLRRLLPLLEPSPKARQQFVTSGALMRLQRVIKTLGDKGREYAESINKLFPRDVVEYFTAGAVGPPPGSRPTGR